MSNLSAFDFIQNRSEATTGLFNRFLSILSANIAAVNSNASLSAPSGNTVSIATNLDLTGGAHFQFLSVGSTPPSYVTTAAITVAVNSSFSDYLYLTDSSGQRSSYVIGSRAGGLADGLNIWDASAGTMIASFSKQSVRFFQNVVGPVFDLGGALTGTYNAAVFKTGGISRESAIQAAISQASIDSVPRVFLPSSMLSYNPTNIVFENGVQMVREGGSQDHYDVLAYGAHAPNIPDNIGCQAAGNAAAAKKGICYFPPGFYQIFSTLTFTAVNDVQFLGGAGNSSSLVQAANNVYLLSIAGVSNRITIRDLALTSFISWTDGGGLRIVGTVATHSGDIAVEGVTSQNVPYPFTFQLVDKIDCRNLKGIQSIQSAVVGPVMSLATVISSNVDKFIAYASVGSFPTDVVQVNQDCDTVKFINSEALHGIGHGWHCQKPAGSTGPRLTRFTNCYAESNLSCGFAIDDGRDIRLEGCHSAVNGAHGYAVTGGTSLNVTNSLALINGSHGIVIAGGHGVTLNGNACSNNGHSANNTYDGINLSSSVTDVIVVGNRSGDFILVDVNKQRWGLNIGFGSDYIKTWVNALEGNVSGTVVDSTVGANNLVLDNTTVRRLPARTVVLTDAASITVDPTAGTYFTVVLGGNRTMATPSNGGGWVGGQRITFQITQDGTGGRTLAWGAAYRQAWSDAGNAAGLTSTIVFVEQGGLWIQESAQVPYV